jgi:hypothetical protein
VVGSACGSQQTEGELPIFKSIFFSNQLVGDMVSVDTTVTFGVGFNRG